MKLAHTQSQPVPILSDTRSGVLPQRPSFSPPGGSMKRSVSFNSLVAQAEAHGPTEYKRVGYTPKERRRYWRFESERHDRDDEFFYCELSEELETADQHGRHGAQPSAKSSNEDLDPSLADLMRSIGVGGY